MGSGAVGGGGGGGAVVDGEPGNVGNGDGDVVVVLPSPGRMSRAALMSWAWPSAVPDGEPPTTT